MGLLEMERKHPGEAQYLYSQPREATRCALTFWGRYSFILIMGTSLCDTLGENALKSSVLFQATIDWLSRLKLTYRADAN